MQQLFVLPHDAVFGFGQHAHQRVLVQRVQHGHHRHTADQLRDQAELDQIVRLHLFQQLLARLVLVQRRAQLAAEAHRGVVGTALDELFQPIERTAADEQDVFGVDLDKLLLRMLAAAVGRHVADRALHDLEQRLLHALAADIPRDGGVLALAGDLVDLVDVDDADLRLGDVKIRRLDQFEQDVLDILAHITGFGQRRGVGNGERHTQHFGQRLRQQRLAGARRPQHQHVGLLQLNFALLPGEDAFVVVVDRDREHFFGFILADDILVEAGFDLGRGQDIDALQRVGVVAGLPGAAPRAAAGARRGRAVAVLIQRAVAHIDAVFADVDPGADQKLFHLILGAPAKAADQLASFSVLAGRCVCHVVPPNQCL